MFVAQQIPPELSAKHPNLEASRSDAKPVSTDILEAVSIAKYSLDSRIREPLPGHSIQGRLSKESAAGR